MHESDALDDRPEAPAPTQHARPYKALHRPERWGQARKKVDRKTYSENACLTTLMAPVFLIIDRQYLE
jgi:hypothetical protein